MRILYVAKHNQSQSTDDEGAIAHALTTLGHEVICWQESKGGTAHRKVADLLLFHKWEDMTAIQKVKMPKVFWYFDLVDFPDRHIRPRCLRRIRWMKQVIPLCDLGFCTDGDWVNQDKSGKLVRLNQGADVRIAGRGTMVDDKPPPILFTGIANGGAGRFNWVAEMNATYRDKFNHRNRGLWREDLRDTIANTKIVVAPDDPVTNHYWSNRVYNVLGFGGFLIHPYCQTLATQYEEGKEIVYYRDRGELHNAITKYINKPDLRGPIREAGLARTLAKHTYTHRCRKLIRIVEERIL